MNERYYITDILPEEDTYIYIEIDAQLGYLIYSGVCWSLLKMFSNEDLISGKKKLRFFSQSKYDPFLIEDGYSFSPIDDLFLNLRVCKL